MGKSRARRPVARVRPGLADPRQPRPPATSSSQPPAAGVPADHVLDLLSLLADDQRALDRRWHQLVSQGRSSGCTWTQLAQALGVSPQSVQQRAARVHRS